MMPHAYQKWIMLIYSNKREKFRFPRQWGSINQRQKEPLVNYHYRWWTDLIRIPRTCRFRMFNRYRRSRAGRHQRVDHNLSSHQSHSRWNKELISLFPSHVPLIRKIRELKVIQKQLGIYEGMMRINSLHSQPMRLFWVKNLTPQREGRDLRIIGKSK